MNAQMFSATKNQTLNYSKNDFLPKQPVSETKSVAFLGHNQIVISEQYYDKIADRLSAVTNPETVTALVLIVAVKMV